MTDLAMNEASHVMTEAPPPQGEIAVARRARFAHDRFGIFVHLGLSASLEGWWEGERYSGLSEWIMFGKRIPLSRYRKLAEQFTLNEFNAEEWVRTMRDAGARYLVYIAKHHDGFAMYHSSASSYNIVEATPFARDLLAELREACNHYGLGLGVYYSHMIDWESPHAKGPQMNDWDFDPSKANFDTYWNEKALPQIEELCTQYGELEVFWFDMPSGLSPAHADEAVALVRKFQPAAVINSRVGAVEDFDYVSTDDNYPQNLLPRRDWEMPATMNASWGWKRGDDDWKPLRSHLYTMAHLAARNGNYLLNVGPKKTGAFPQPARDTFKALAQYCKAIETAIVGTGAGPFPQTFSWGVITCRERSLFLHVFDQDRKAISLPGPALGIVGSLNAVTGEEYVGGVSVADMVLPEVSDKEGARIVEIQLASSPQPLDLATQVQEDNLHLDIWEAERRGDQIIWRFKMNKPGSYRVDLISKDSNNTQQMEWHGAGLSADIKFEGGVCEMFTIDEGIKEYSALYHFWYYHRHPVLEIEVPKVGEYRLVITGLPITDDKWEKGKLNLLRAEISKA